MANLTTKQAFLNQKKNSSDYWRDREDTQAIINEQMLNSFDSDVQQLYNSMIAECEKEIQSFYQKYASDGGITLSAAKKKVSNMDVKAYESEAERLVKTKKLTQKAKEELKLYNATMKINRLRLLEANIGLHLVNGYSDLERMTKQKMTDETIAEYKRQAGILGETVKDVETRAKNLVNQSFQNATWSERIWTNQTALKNTLSTELMRGMIAGKSAFTIASNIRKRFDVSSTEAKRLARTELVRCQAGAQIDSYTEHGWKEYEFRAYGSKSCEICRALNGKHYPLADAMPAENLPPMHPYCRCSTIPYEDEDEYQRWLDSFGKSAETLDFSEENNIINTQTLLQQTTKITEKEYPTTYGIVDRQLVNSKQYHDKFEGLTGRKPVDETIYQESMTILEHRDGTPFEDLTVLDKRTGKIVTRVTDSKKSGRLTISEEQRKIIEEYDGEIVLLHNHPNGSRPSYTDILRLQDKNVSSVIAVGHDGSVYEISDYDRGVDIQGLWNALFSEYKKMYDRANASKYATDELYKTNAFKTKKR